MKTADHFWTDPSADELVQRHRIHGGHCRQDSPTKRPALCVSIKAGNTADVGPGEICLHFLQISFYFFPNTVFCFVFLFFLNDVPINHQRFNHIRKNV